MKITTIKGHTHYYNHDKDYDGYIVTENTINVYKCNEYGTRRDIAIFPIRNIESIIFDEGVDK